MSKKKIILLTLSLMMLCHAKGQFTISSPAEHVLLTDPQYNIDAIAVFNTLPMGSELRFTGGGSFMWSYDIGGVTYTSTQAVVDAEDGVLYKIMINGVATYFIYVIDYSRYLSSCDMILLNEGMSDICEYAKIDVMGHFPDITYLDKTGSQRTLPRFYDICYTTSAWNGTEWEDSVAVATGVSVGNVVSYTISAPLKDCTIAFYGDSLAMYMQLRIDTCYQWYHAVAVKAYPKGTVIEREPKNEKDRSSQSAIQGSAPLVVQLKANVNPLTNPFVEWRIWNIKDSAAALRFVDETVNFTFEETGDYKAMVTIQSENCKYTETLDIKTLESFIEVPNVFTPNDDGINDEFRVAFKSIREYTIWIYNRWGRLVYKSTDPGKGWDGKINGKPAAVGTYYYVINAYGEDYDDKGKRVHYKMSGDCNLLR